jgi:hypothetical protein
MTRRRSPRNPIPTYRRPGPKPPVTWRFNDWAMI